MLGGKEQALSTIQSHGTKITHAGAQVAPWENKTKAGQGGL